MCWYFLTPLLHTQGVCSRKNKALCRRKSFTSYHRPVLPWLWWQTGSSSRSMNIPSSSAWQPAKKRRIMEDREAALAFPWNLLPALLRRRPNRILCKRQQIRGWLLRDQMKVSLVNHSYINVSTFPTVHLGPLLKLSNGVENIGIKQPAAEEKADSCKQWIEWKTELIYFFKKSTMEVRETDWLGTEGM